MIFFSGLLKFRFVVGELGWIHLYIVEQIKELKLFGNLIKYD